MQEKYHGIYNNSWVPQRCTLSLKENLNASKPSINNRASTTTQSGGKHVCIVVVVVFFTLLTDRASSSSSSSSTPLYCLRENISFDTLIRRSSRGHNSRKATQPSHCGTCLILLIFIAKRVQPSLPSSTLRSNFVYPRQISRSPRVGHCMS